MPLFALIPQPSSDFSEDPKTTLPVIRAYGRECIVDPESSTVRSLAVGISCLLDTDIATLKLTHPDAWVSNNPMLGHWTSVDPHYRLPQISERGGEVEVELKLNLYYADQRHVQALISLAHAVNSTRMHCRGWRAIKAHQTLK